MKDVSSLPSMRSRINSSQFVRSEYPVWHEGGRGRRPGLITALIGGARTGRMTARPWKNRKIKKLFAVNGSCAPGYGMDMQLGYCSLTAIRAKSAQCLSLPKLLQEYPG